MILDGGVLPEAGNQTSWTCGCAMDGKDEREEMQDEITDHMSRPFCERLLPAPVGGGFAMPEYWIWCGSVIRGDDGLYHMFASRWPRSLTFQPHWLTNSEIVRATSPTPEGPYTFAEVVLPPRGREFWDGRMTHNPTIHRAGKTYLLYYTGTTYDGPTPAPGQPCTEAQRRQARNQQRIGLATAPSPAGPWTRRDAPIIDTRPGKWDAILTANPAPLVHDDGSVLMIYKSRSARDDKMRHGLVRAAHFDGPYERVQDEPIFPEESANAVEDPFLWWEDGCYQVLVHDVLGHVGGETDCIGHGTSPDALHWTWSQPGLACSRTIRWSDGRVTRHPRVERPQLLFQDGRPTHLFVSTGEGPEPSRRGDRNSMVRSWNMAIPLR
jgi:hypothetical protein